MKAIFMAALLLAAGSAHATGNADLEMASRALHLDGIKEARIVGIVEATKPFVFTYCRKDSSALWRHEVMSTHEPDALRPTQKIVRDQAVESVSDACKTAS